LFFFFLVFFSGFIRTFLSYSKIWGHFFFFLLVLGEGTLIFFDSLKGDIDTIGSLGRH
jgi:hypothetical protein